ncbi:MAG: phage portal protein [Bacteroides sp.]|nr:phage portal protein [Eubacterium sp.]MCM1419636.1 phage portal protein [Roseburia sp.]MCM1462974.1 phage portal protein [Bacteroides sp.]
MSIYTEIRQAFPKLAVPDISDYYTREIESAKRVYQGSPPWKQVRHAGVKKKRRDMALLNAAKVVCDKMAALTYSEQCEITTTDESCQRIVEEVLAGNAFQSKFPEWLSRAYAMGGGILKLRVERGEIAIDYLNADVFFPTKWNNRRITEGIFRSTYVKNGKFYRLFEYQHMTESGVTVENSVFESDERSALGTKRGIKELFSECEENTVFTGIKQPLFVYFKPAIGNNRCFDTPLGLPIFANSYDTLKGIDVIFDSLQREYILGKKRIIVPSELIKTEIDGEGNEVRYFDANDEVFQALTSDEAAKLPIVDNTTALRVREHIDGLNAQLDLLSMQIGLSAGSLSFNSKEGLKTATEVVANERDTLRTVENNKNIVSEAIRELCGGIVSVHAAIRGETRRDCDFSVNWKDNVISDDDTRIRQNIELTGAGLRSRLSAIMDIRGCSEEEAKKELARIAADGTGASADDLFGGGDE